MTKTVETRAASAIRELSIDELGLAAGGASQFIASIAAALLPTIRH